MDTRFKKHFQKKKLPNGKANPKYVDLLDEDSPINGQNFCVISFVSPEEHIRNKDVYMFEEFVHDWDFNKSMEKFDAFLHMMEHKYAIKYEDIKEDLTDFVREEQTNLRFTVLPDYKTYIEKNEERLEKEYMEQNKFQTCVRGVKFRGVFATQEEADARVSYLKERDKTHDVFVGEMMKWMPFHPKAYRTGNVVYMEEELNQLMHEKAKNEQKAKQEFDDRIREAKEKAMEENRKKAAKTGNVLTQTIDDEGELAAIESFVDKLGKTHTFNPVQQELNAEHNEKVALAEATGRLPPEAPALVSQLSPEEIQQRMLDAANVVMGKTDHGQSNLRSGPFAASTATEQTKE